MRVTASTEAGVYVRERGGRLYVWFHSLGPRSGWGTLRIATDPPTGEEIGFEEIQTGAFELFLDEELPRPRELRIDLVGRLRKRLRVRGFPEGYAGDSGFFGGGGNGGGNGGGGG